MTDINVPLLRKALEHITEHPEEWRQGDWALRCDQPTEVTNGQGECETFCGTSFCLAGHVAVMTGHEISWRQNPHATGTSNSFWVVGGDRISDVARDELGLTERQAESLFAGSNTLDYLWRRASLYTDGAIEVPEEFQ